MGVVAVARTCDADAVRPPARGSLSLLRAGLPLVVSRAGLAAMIVADGWMVARHETGQLALSSLAGGTFGRLTEVFATAVLSGLPLVAAAAGRFGHHRDAWRRATAMALVLGLVAVAVAGCAAPILRAAINDPEVVRDTAALVWVLGLGLPAGLVALASAMYLEGLGRSVRVAAWVVSANALNILLNWLLIGGHAGFPAWGAYGSGLATTLVRVALASALVVSVWRLERGALFTAGRSEKTGAQWRLALGAGGTVAGFHASAIWLTLFAGWLGPQALAAFASCWVLTMPAMLLSIGIGDAIGLRAATQGGGTGTLRRDLACLAVILAPFALVLSVVPESLSALYTPDPALRVLIGGLLPIGGTVLLLDGLSYGIGAAQRARGDVAGSTAIQLGTLAVTPLLAGWLAFRAELGLQGLMLAILTTSALRLAFLVIRVRLCVRHLV